MSVLMHWPGLADCSHQLMEGAVWTAIAGPAMSVQHPSRCMRMVMQAAGVGGSDGAATDTAGSTERRATNGQASVSGEEQEQPQSLLGQLVDGVKSLALRGSVYASFFVAKQPARIRQVLTMSVLHVRLFQSHSVHAMPFLSQPLQHGGDVPCMQDPMSSVVDLLTSARASSIKSSRMARQTTPHALLRRAGAAAGVHR